MNPLVLPRLFDVINPLFHTVSIHKCEGPSRMNKRGDFREGITIKPIPELFDLHGMSGGWVWHMTRGLDEGFPASATGIAGFIIEDRDTKKDRQGMAKVVKIEAIRNMIHFARSKPETLFFVQ